MFGRKNCSHACDVTLILLYITQGCIYYKQLTLFADNRVNRINPIILFYIGRFVVSAGVTPARFRKQLLF